MCRPEAQQDACVVGDPDEVRRIQAEAIQGVGRRITEARVVRRDVRADSLAGLPDRVRRVDPDLVGERREPGQGQRIDDVAARNTTTGSSVDRPGDGHVAVAEPSPDHPRLGGEWNPAQRLSYRRSTAARAASDR